MLRNAASLSTYPTFTWAGLPAAASAQGQIVRVTDFGVPSIGLLVFSDGVRWVPLGPQILARSAVAASVTGTTAETVLATATVPAGLLGLNGELLVYSTWSYPNSANNKTMRGRLGGIAGTAFMAVVQAASVSYSEVRRVRNRNSAASQVGSANVTVSGGVGASTGAIPTGAVDTTVAQDFVFTGQLALGTETITLENYEVWVTP